MGFFCNFAENYYNMTQRKPIIAVIACLIEACIIISCQKAETQQQLDKDEEHGGTIVDSHVPRIEPLRRS